MTDEKTSPKNLYSSAQKYAVHYSFSFMFFGLFYEFSFTGGVHFEL